MPRASRRRPRSLREEPEREVLAAAELLEDEEQEDKKEEKEEDKQEEKKEKEREGGEVMRAPRARRPYY